jgi:hypothetical protein
MSWSLSIRPPLDLWIPERRKGPVASAGGARARHPQAKAEKRALDGPVCKKRPAFLNLQPLKLHPSHSRQNMLGIFEVDYPALRVAVHHTSIVWFLASCSGHSEPGAEKASTVRLRTSHHGRALPPSLSLLAIGRSCHPHARGEPFTPLTRHCNPSETSFPASEFRLEIQNANRIVLVPA